MPKKILEVTDVNALQTMGTIVSDTDAPNSFQIIVKTVKGFVITIDDLTPESTIRSVMQKIEEKDRIPYEQTGLFYESQLLELDQTLQDYNITAGANLQTLLGLKGGRGEHATMQYVDDKQINRGNVKVEIMATHGESKALKDWGRNLSNDPQFWQAIKDQLDANRATPLTPQEMNNWIANNYTHVTALIQETTHSGNCGDIAAITHSHLVRTTTDQFVYMLTMCNPRPDKDQDDPGWLTATPKERKEWFLANPIKRILINHTRKESPSGLLKLDPANYDHQLCMTYHKYVSSLAEVDPQRAMIADGWDSNMVTTLELFMQAGGNAYKDTLHTNLFGIPFPNLRLSQAQYADGQGGLAGQGVEDPIRNIIESRLRQYKRSPYFAADKAAALEVTTNLFEMQPRSGVYDNMPDFAIRDKLNSIPVPKELDIFRRECLDVSPETLLAYFLRVDGSDKGDIMIQTPQIAHRFLTELPIAALEAACTRISTESFIKYIHVPDVIPALTRSELLCLKIGHTLANDVDNTTLISICNNLFSYGCSGLVFSTLRDDADILQIIHTLWQQGQYDEGDTCLNAVAHLPTFQQVLTSLSISEIKDYIDRQNIWENSNMLHSYRRQNKPTISVIARYLSIARLKEFRTAIGLAKWNSYVVGQLSNQQKAGL